MGAADHRRARPEPVDRGDTDRHWSRRGLWLADAPAGGESPRADRLLGALQTAGRWAGTRSTGPLARRDRGYRAAPQTRNLRQIRLHWCRRWCAAAVAEVRHSRRSRLWRLPGEWHLAALRRERGQQPTSRQGLRPGGGRIATDVGPAPRHPHYRRQEVAAVRAICRILYQIPQARLAH